MLYHLEDIEIIRAYEQIVRNSGTEVFDISHWDSGQDYNKLLLSTLNIPKTFRPCNYVYSYEIPLITKTFIVLDISLSVWTCPICLLIISGMLNIMRLSILYFEVSFTLVEDFDLSRFSALVFDVFFDLFGAILTQSPTIETNNCKHLIILSGAEIHSIKEPFSVFICIGGSDLILNSCWIDDNTVHVSIVGFSLNVNLIVILEFVGFMSARASFRNST